MKIREHLLLAAVTAASIATLEWLVGVRAAGVTGGGPALLVAVGALTTVALAVGLVQAGALRAVERFGARPRHWLDRHTTRDREAPREPVIALHATLLVLVVAAALGLTLLDLLLRFLETVPDEAVRRRMTLLCAALATFFALGVGVVLRRLATRALGAFDRRFGLPWPSSGALRRLLWVLVPAAALLLGLLLVFGGVLGVLAWPAALALFFVAEALVLELARALGGRVGRAKLPLEGVLAALLLGAALLAARGAGNLESLAGAKAASSALAVLRAATDVDRDGFSSLYAGGDCAAFSSNIAPMQREIAGNGVDENCDGKDGRSAPRRGMAPERQLHGDIRSLGVTPKRYNVIWFMSEAMRMDYTTLGGFEGGDTTPYLEELAEEALVFERAYSQSTATMLSVPSMFSGRDPATLRFDVQRGRLQPHDSEVLLAERLKQLGYRTLMISDGYLRARLPGLHQGFEDVRSFWLDGKRMPWYRRAAAVSVSQAIGMMEEDPKVPENTQPFFLFVYLADPHDPYERHTTGFPHFGRGEKGNYASEIAYTDRYVGFFLDYLRYQPPLWDNTIVIFNGDHGEDFREHGTRTHGFNCNRQGSHVPLVMRIPGLPAKRVSRNVGLIDIMPTLFEALGEEPGEMKLDGQSLLLPAFAEDSVDPERPVFCATLLQGAGKDNFFWRGVRSGDRALLHDAITGRRELYDTVNDFDEAKNLIGRPEEAETERRLGALLESTLTGNLWEERLVR